MAGSFLAKAWILFILLIVCIGSLRSAYSHSKILLHCNWSMTFRFNGDIQKIESPSPLEIYQKLKTLHWLTTNLIQLYDPQYYQLNHKSAAISRSRIIKATKLMCESLSVHWHVCDVGFVSQIVTWKASACTCFVKINAFHFFVKHTLNLLFSLSCQDQNFPNHQCLSRQS